jgi:hypothetical protein
VWKHWLPGSTDGSPDSHQLAHTWNCSGTKMTTSTGGADSESGFEVEQCRHRNISFTTAPNQKISRKHFGKQWGRPWAAKQVDADTCRSLSCFHGEVRPSGDGLPGGYWHREVPPQGSGGVRSFGSVVTLFICLFVLINPFAFFCQKGWWVAGVELRHLASLPEAEVFLGLSYSK